MWVEDTLELVCLTGEGGAAGTGTMEGAGRKTRMTVTYSERQESTQGQAID